MKTAITLALAPMLFFSTAADAALWLSGVVVYGANAGGGSVTEPAEYDNIVGTGNSGTDVNGQPRGTTFPLSLGLNNFSCTNVSANFNALSLYFSTTDGAFNRPSASVPDLVTYSVANVGLTPGAGAGVQTNGQFSGTVAWTGASSYTGGGLYVTVSGFTLGNGAGTVQLTVRAVPEPSLSLGLIPAATLLLTRRRR